jgi:hypothetical protein
MAQVNASRQYQVNLSNGWRQPYYPHQNYAYNNINGAGEYIPQPFVPNTGLNFFGIHIGGGRRGGFGLNIGLGNPGYGAYGSPYQTAFIPQPVYYPQQNAAFAYRQPWHHGRGGIQIAAAIQPSWYNPAQNYNYYSNPTYASTYAGGQQYDQYGNPIGYA